MFWFFFLVIKHCTKQPKIVLCRGANVLWTMEALLQPYAHLLIYLQICNNSQSPLRIKLFPPNEKTLQCRRSSNSQECYPADRPPTPQEVTLLSPCCCRCLAPHASHIPSPHLDTRCSWIISHTGESLLTFSFPSHLDSCFTSPIFDTSRHSLTIFYLFIYFLFCYDILLLLFIPLLQRAGGENLDGRMQKSVLSFSPLVPPPTRLIWIEK